MLKVSLFHQKGKQIVFSFEGIKLEELNYLSLEVEGLY